MKSGLMYKIIKLGKWVGLSGPGLAQSLPGLETGSGMDVVQTSDRFKAVVSAAMSCRQQADSALPASPSRGRLHCQQSFSRALEGALISLNALGVD
eukprot:jgi/Ulvmu1/8629/UM046_0032.1